MHMDNMLILLLLKHSTLRSHVKLFFSFFSLNFKHHNSTAFTAIQTQQNYYKNRYIVDAPLGIGQQLIHFKEISL